MKKLIVFTLVFCVCAALLSGCAGPGENTDHGNYTDEMKIGYACDLSEADGLTAWSGTGITGTAPTSAGWTSTTWSPAIP